MVLLVTLGLTDWYVGRLLLRDENKQLDSLASVQVSRLSYIAQHQVERFALIASRTRMRQLTKTYQQAPDPDTAAGILKNLNDAKSSLGQLSAVGISDTQGNWISATDPRRFPDRIGSKPWFQTALRAPGIYDFAWDKDKIPVMYIAGPVLLNKQAIGVLVLQASLDSLDQVTGDYTGLGASGETLMATKDEQGNALFLTATRFDPQAALTRTVSKDALDVPMTQALRGAEDINNAAVDYRGEPVIAIARLVPETGWGVVVKQDRTEVLRPLAEFREAAGAIALLILSGAVFMTLLISRALSRPITQLTSWAHQIRQSNVRARASQAERDPIDRLREQRAETNEVKMLGEVMEDMTTALLSEKSHLEQRVTERTQELEATAAELLESQERFAIAVEGSSDGLWDWPNVTRREMWFSNRLYELLELKPGDFAATIDRFGGLIDEEMRTNVIRRLLKLSVKGGKLEDEFIMRTGSGEQRWFALRCTCKLDNRTGSYRMAGSLQDIMAAKVIAASNQRLLEDRQRQATHDPLTRILNRRGFEERWEVELSRSRRLKTDLILMIVDADHFKHVNDTWGHKVGDEVLVKLAESLRNCLRDTDIAARFGGEEFVVVLVDTDLDTAVTVANRMREYTANQAYENDDGAQISVTCSIGLTRHGQENTLDDTLKKADEALYRAKEAGRNRVVVS